MVSPCLEVVTLRLIVFVNFIQFLQKILKDCEFKRLGRMVMTVWLGNIWLWETTSPSALGAEGNVKTALPFMFSSFLKPCSMKVPLSPLILEDPGETVFPPTARCTVILLPCEWRVTALQTAEEKLEKEGETKAVSQNKSALRCPGRRPHWTLRPS